LRVALFTGELSGELYAYHVISALSDLLGGELSVIGIGGPNLERLSFFKPLAHISDLSLIGVVDVLKEIGKLLKLFDHSVKETLSFLPHLVLLVDSPDFNLRLAKALRKMGFKGKIVYLIPPTAWIWRKGRAKILRDFCDLVITLFDFEAEWYRSRGVKAHFLGHPLIDILPESPDMTFEKPLKKPVLACFPGSRRKEVEYLLPVMREVASRWEGSVLFSRVKSLPLELYGAVSPLLEEPSYVLLGSCDFVLAASGTIAVEALVYEKPAVIIYKGSIINYILYKILVNAPFISMPNIMLGREVYPELIQGKANADEIMGRFLRWLEDEEAVHKVKEVLRLLKGRLGERGAIRRIASLILNEVASFS